MSNPIEAPSRPVDTAKVINRRLLHFDSIDEVLADVDRLVEAERAGRLKHVGNWTLGQVLGHLACWSEYGYNGCPLKPPFFIRWILRLGKNSFLYKPMKPGARIPRVPGGTLATDPMFLDEALPRFRKVMERLKTETPAAPNVIFGKMTHEESIALNLRHAELHLGFMVPK
jgi:Protein of unknown function (DUF1569)